MKRRLSLFGLALFLSTSAVAQTPNGPFRVEVTYFSIKPWMKSRVESAVPLIEQAMSSAEFRRSILEFRSKSGDLGFEWNEGLSNTEILALIDEGRELAYEGGVGQMDISLQDYWRPSSTVATTSPDSPLIRLNRYKYRHMDEADVANNLVHEWLHKIGFGHSYKWTPVRDDTVPYAVGDLVEKWIRDLP